MDPLTAFSVAGTVIQFVDFGSKLLLGARDLYKSSSGALSGNDELALVTADLQSVLLKLSTSTLKSPDPLNPPSVEEQNLQKSFDKICNEAKNLADELTNRLEALRVDKHLKGSQRVWASLFQAVKSAWSKEELEALNLRLRNLKEAMESRVLFSLRENFDLFSVRVSKRFDSLDLQTQNIVSALLEDRKIAAKRFSYDALEQTATLSHLLSRLEVSNIEEHRRTRAMIANTGNGEITPSIEVLDVPYHEEAQIRMLVGNKILKSLRFSTMTDRFEQVTEAYQKTFNWIFDETTDDQLPWANFAEWLQCGAGLYWINGKAGSGKSTLMKFIYENSRTRQFLGHWATDVPLYTSSFFFWNSGTPEQRSLHGLLRALLFEVLNQQPDLIPIVLPLIWARTYSRMIADKAGIVNESWSLGSLRDALKMLGRQEMVPLKLCLFIDGLDEFDGDHEEMANLLKGITSSHIKVCVSSRPWVVFDQCFKDCLGLRLQDLTRLDIEHYVQGLLVNNTAFQKLSARDPASTSPFIREIVEKADGVFLWVVLVVKSLLNGIRNRDSTADLQNRLRRLPRELEPLYDHLLDLIEPEYFPWASKAFQILRTVQQFHESHQELVVENQKNMDDRSIAGFKAGTLSILGLYLAVTDDLDLCSVQSWSPSILAARCEDAEIQLTARCAGLLETSGSPGPHSQVNYLHRTAQDYLKRPAVWEVLLSHTPPESFNPNVSLLSSFVLQLGIKYAYPSQMTTWPWMVARCALLHAHYAESQQLKPKPNDLDNLETLMTSYAKSTIRGHFSHWTIQWTKKLELPEAKSFLPIAVIYGLNSYLRSKNINAEAGLLETGASLLHYSIPRNWAEKQSLVPQASTVELLLKAGYDPNLAYNLKSPWQQALSYARGQQIRGDAWEEQIQLFQILTLMLNAGANPQVNIQIDGHIYSVQKLLHEAKENQDLFFSVDIPPELHALSNAIEKARDENVGVRPESALYLDDMKKSKKKKLQSWIGGLFKR